MIPNFREHNVLAISHFDKANRIFEGYCEGIKANSNNYNYIDYLDLYLQKGKRGCEEAIEKLVIEGNIDCIFLILRSADLTFDVRFIERLSKLSFVIMNFFDTEYYFEPCDRYYAQTADLVILPDYLSKYRYELLNINALCTFSLFDKNYYRFLNRPDKDIDVSFIGNVATSNRREYADYLVKNGVPIELYGANTPNGFVDFAKMISIFNRSKININFTGTMTSFMFGLMHRLNINQRIRQVKGRPIEVALCGGFVLSEYAPGIENMFEIGKEIDIFHTKEELLEKIKYYLKNEEERKEIARRGYERAVRDYDCVSGFEKVFSNIENLRRSDKFVYLDDHFVVNFVSYRFYYITLFILNGKINALIEELRIILQLKRFSISKAFHYSLKAMGRSMGRYPGLKRKLMRCLRIPSRD